MVDKSNKMPYGFEQTGTNFSSISQGDAPHLGMELARYLPVIKHDNRKEAGKTVMAGTIMTVDKQYDTDRLVPCNGFISATSAPGTYAAEGTVTPTAELTANGVERILLYTDQLDVDNVLDPNDLDTVITSVDADNYPNGSKTLLKPTKPCGCIPYDGYNAALSELYHNFKPQASVAIWAHRYVEIPLCMFNEMNSLQSVGYALDYDATVGTMTYGGSEPADVDTMIAAVDVDNPLTEWVPGMKLIPDHMGRFIPFTHGVDNPNQIVGRVIYVGNIGEGPTSTRGLDMVATYPGLGLAGDQTSGVLNHLIKKYGDGSGDNCKRYARILLNF